MTAILYFLGYNLLFIPLFYFSLFLAAIFNTKIRQGLVGRFALPSQIRKLKRELAGEPIVVLHCASMGEFEHTKPFLLKLKQMRPKFRIVVLFFSPSGYRNVKPFPAVDAFLYSPHEWLFSIFRFLKKLKPVLWIIAKYDVWPNQVWLCRWLNIPIFLMNASLHHKSSRLFWASRPFNRSVYNNFSKILTVSEIDRQNFTRLVPPDNLLVVGDTKFDQVIFRRDESYQMELIPREILKDRWIFVAGSTWPEDHFHLIPALQNLREKYPQILCFICPHEPTAAHIGELTSHLPPNDVLCLSEMDSYQHQSFIVIDRFGMLANLYSIAKVAYVGGGFKQHIHNVLEAAVYRIPVLFGPINQNFQEAQSLKVNRGGWEVRNTSDIQQIIEKFIINEVFRQETGLKAFTIVEKNLGATTRTIEIIAEFLEAGKNKLK